MALGRNFGDVRTEYSVMPTAGPIPCAATACAPKITQAAINLCIAICPYKYSTVLSFFPAEDSAFSDGGGFSGFAPAKRVPTSENDALCKSRDNVRRVVSLLPQALQDLSRTTTLGLPARGVLGT